MSRSLPTLFVTLACGLWLAACAPHEGADRTPPADFVAPDLDGAAKSDRLTDEYTDERAPLVAGERLDGSTAGAPFVGHAFDAAPGDVLAVDLAATEWAALLIYGPADEDGRWGPARLRVFTDYIGRHHEEASLAFEILGGGRFLAVAGPLFAADMAYAVRLSCLDGPCAAPDPAPEPGARCHLYGPHCDDGFRCELTCDPAENCGINPPGVCVPVEDDAPVTGGGADEGDTPPAGGDPAPDGGGEEAPGPAPGDDIDPDGGPAPAPACAVQGCSGQLCVAADAEPVFTTCEWRPSYACYQQTRCGPYGANGACAWEATPEFVACMDDSR